MWKREKNHLVWTEPWVFVQLPGQEIVYAARTGEGGAQTPRTAHARRDVVDPVGVPVKNSSNTLKR